MLFLLPIVRPAGEMFQCTRQRSRQCIRLTAAVRWTEFAVGFTPQDATAKKNFRSREAAMYLRPSDATASLQLSSRRKCDLLDYYEANVDELDRWRTFNAAYHEDDNKFMRFLIPPGKRVLELGCGR